MVLQARHVYGAGLDEPVVFFDAAGNRFHPHQDGHGSVFAISNAAAAVTGVLSYGPYGETQAAAGYPYRYAGRRFDVESGLYFNRARACSPALGRFLQPDPIGTAGGINLYAYVGNDPINYVDPMGRWSVSVDFFLGGFTFGIGEGSGQAFITGRFGMALGAYFAPGADIPMGKSGTWPTSCANCTTPVRSSYWDGGAVTTSATLGHVSVSVAMPFQTTVNELNSSGAVVSSTYTPVGPVSTEVSFSTKRGVHFDVGPRYEWGKTIPWSDPAPTQPTPSIGLSVTPSAGPSGKLR